MALPASGPSSHAFDALKLDNQLCFPLYAASREVIKRYHPYLQELRLTYTQYIAMMVLWEEKQISAKALGQKLFLDSGTLTPVLKSLAEKGFIDRRRSSDDERLLLVELTPAGEALKEQAVSIPAKVARCVKLGTEDVLQLYRLLYQVLDALKE